MYDIPVAKARAGIAAVNAFKRITLAQSVSIFYIIRELSKCMISYKKDCTLNVP